MVMETKNISDWLTNKLNKTTERTVELDWGKQIPLKLNENRAKYLKTQGLFQKVLGYIVGY